MRMDDVDRQILGILKEDGRASYTGIADKIEVSEATVRNRIEKLEENGTIERFTVDLNENGMSAIVMVKLSTDAEIRGLVEQLPEKITVSEVTGEFDIVVEISRESSEELNDTLDSIRRVEGVLETQTHSVLKQRRL